MKNKQAHCRYPSKIGVVTILVLIASGLQAKDFYVSPDVQLFNLAEDLGETNNLQAEHPERVKALTALLNRYVENGRSTEGPAQSNATEVNIYALPIKR